VSEANDLQIAAKKANPTREVVTAVLELFELLVAQASDEHVSDLENFANEWKPRLEAILRKAKR